MATQEEIDSFTRFAAQQLSAGGTELSMDQLYDRWRSQSPRAEELAEGVAAVKAALADMEAGDEGIPADVHLARLRSKFNIAQ